MSEYKKFIFEELSVDSVIHLKSAYKLKVEKDNKFITEAIVNHLSNIMNDCDNTIEDDPIFVENDKEECIDYNNVQNAESILYKKESKRILKDVAQDAEIINNELFNENNNDNQEEVKELSKENQEEIYQKVKDQIRQEIYEEVRQDLQNQYKYKREELESDKRCCNLLEEKLKGIVNDNRITDQMMNMIRTIILTISRKLSLDFPLKFEKIIYEELLDKLNNYYKEGSIKIIIHPNRVNLCQKVLRSDIIKNEFKDNFLIEEDSGMNENDCKVEWNDSYLLYNHQRVKEEVEEIINQLKI